MQVDEEAQDTVDVQPYPDATRNAPRAFPWIVLIVGAILSSVFMATMSISSIVLSRAIAHFKSR
jgi:hypothetical protein